MTPTDNRAAIFRWRSALQRSDVMFDVRATLWMLAQYADNHSLVCWPGQKKLCDDNNLSKSALNRKLDKALESGWLVVEERGGKIKGKNTRYRLTFGSAKKCVPEMEHEQVDGENWVPYMENCVPDMNDLGPSSGTPTTHELLMDNYSLDIRSTDVDHMIEKQNETEEEKALPPSVPASFPKDLSTSRIAAARPLPAEWHPNGSHVTAAKRHGINAIALAKVFRSWAVGEGVVTSDWDLKFGYLISAYGTDDGRSPEDHGMYGIGDYSDHPDDPEWFLGSEYRWIAPVAALSVPLTEGWEPSEKVRGTAANLGIDPDTVLTRLRDENLGKPWVTSNDWDDAYRKLALRMNESETGGVKFVADRQAEWSEFHQRAAEWENAH